MDIHKAKKNPVDVAPVMKQAGWLLLVEFALLFLPLVILGAHINWPASLDEPAGVNLPLIHENHASVMAGYSVYLVYSLLFWPVAYLTGRVIVGDDVHNTLFKIANGFAALSALARSLGIVRWLFTMPALAGRYVDPNTSDAAKENISLMYDVLNSYAGGVGELLGVSLFAVIWLVLICVLMIRSPVWSNWPAYFGFVTATSLLLNVLEVVGVDLGPMITISVVLLHLWMLSMAFVFLKSRAPCADRDESSDTTNRKQAKA